MVRALVIGVALGLLTTTMVVAQDRATPVAKARGRQAVLRKDVERMTVRLGGGRGTSRQVIADARRLTAGYRELIPFVGGFGPADCSLNREVGRESLDWLARTGALYAGNPAVTKALMGTYESIGGFYRDHARFYPYGASAAYAGATRMARLLALDAHDTDRFERDLERLGPAYATLAYAGPHLLPPTESGCDPQEVAREITPQAAPSKPVTLPSVDVSSLDPDQRSAWDDVRERFPAVAARVYEAQLLLSELSTRLEHQHLTLNARDAATAMSMQGFLEDAADLIRAGRLDKAIEALRQAEYQRLKLKGATGR